MLIETSGKKPDSQDRNEQTAPGAGAPIFNSNLFQRSGTYYVEASISSDDANANTVQVSTPGTAGVPVVSFPAGGGNRDWKGVLSVALNAPPPGPLTFNVIGAGAAGSHYGIVAAVWFLG
jgi:hypothetical protein